MRPVTMTIGNIKIAKPEDLFASKDDRRQSEFGDGNGIRLCGVADKNASLEDMFVDNTFYGSARMGASGRVPPQAPLCPHKANPSR
jgi:hypothetical protein